MEVVNELNSALPAPDRLRELTGLLSGRFPEARIALDDPADPAGVWYADIVLHDHHVVVQWHADHGFGISSGVDHAFGEGADEVYQEVEAAYGRLVSLLISGGYTAPPPLRLGALRKELGVSQEALAQDLNVRQAAISKLERREDLLLSTLQSVVRALGGELHVTARFPGGREHRLEFSEPSRSSREHGGS